MDTKPERISKQGIYQTKCVYCTFNNIFQKKVFSSPCRFLNAFEQISKKKKKPIPKNYWGRDGITSDTLRVLLEYYGFNIRKKRTKVDVLQGWAEFELSYQGNVFLHAVAIRDGYVIDSIAIPTNRNGVYHWDGHLYGYDSEKMVALYEIEFIK